MNKERRALAASFACQCFSSKGNQEVSNLMKHESPTKMSLKLCHVLLSF